MLSKRNKNVDLKYEFIEHKYNHEHFSNLRIIYGLWVIDIIANSYFNNLFSSVTVVMQKDKEENSHHDSHYRARELAALAAYDHHHLDGEMFLQVSTGNAHYVEQPVFTISFGRSRILKMHIGSTRSHIYRAVARKDTCFLLALSIDRLSLPTVAEKSIVAYEISRSWSVRLKNKRHGDESREISDRFAISQVLGNRSVHRELLNCLATYTFCIFIFILATN